MHESARHVVLYVLHSGQMYGTERMALATASGLANEFETIFIAPSGLALAEASAMGFETHSYRATRDLAHVLWPLLKRYNSLTLVSTGPRYSLLCMALNLVLSRRVKHIQMIHGGAGEKKDYARKKVLVPFDISFVVVSDWSKGKLASYGVPQERIEVVPNFLPEKSIRTAARRRAFAGSKTKNVLIVARLEELKRVDLLLDALDLRKAELAGMSFKVLGMGTQFLPLSVRAAKDHQNVTFAGFSPEARQEMAEADLLVHTCPDEPFGLVILEAMAAHIPVLVPDTGGAASLVEDGVDGFKYRAGDPTDLAEKLVKLRDAESEKLNEVVASAALSVEDRFSQQKALDRYRALFALEGFASELPVATEASRLAGACRSSQ
jgi:glycosyltransferase involved in cell wall biosynthesis